MHKLFRTPNRLVILSLFSSLSLGLMLFYLSGALVYGGRTYSDYNRPKEPVCSEWYKSEVFLDHRTPIEISRSSLKIPSCEESIQAPKRTEMLTTEEGLRVRLVIPDSPDRSALWLHVHGITDNYLNGMRFTGVAERQDFKLMMLELQNHGGSDRHIQGSSWGCREKYDLFAALDFMHQTWPDKPILLTGTSMGTMTISQAVLTRPEAFLEVQGIIYESPLSSLDNISDRICSNLPEQNICTLIFTKIIPYFARLRTDTNFSSCFKDPSVPTDIPTELWLSRQEFKNPKQIALASLMPAHKNLSIHIFAAGSHSAYYSYGPKEVEEALASFWARTHGLNPTL